jgi:uncharacterized protein YqhQ
VTDEPPSAADATDHAPGPRPAAAPHGGQAVPEGVMMRGAERWAVAVRRPAGDVWLECHPVGAAGGRPGWRRVPLLRGSAALAESWRTGMRALGIAAAQSVGARDDEGGATPSAGSSALVAAGLFVAVFLVLPVSVTAGLDVVTGGALGTGVGFHLVEAALRIVVLLGYLLGVSRIAEVRRLFRYHGAEHQTIAAWEDGEVLEPAVVARYATEHVRCGTNFLALAMLLAGVVFTAVGVLLPPLDGLGIAGVIVMQVLVRVLMLPVVAGLAYEGLRLGAASGDHPLVGWAMRPGLWLQRITTAEPSRDQIEVAIRAFEAVAPASEIAARAPRTLTSPVTLAHRGLAVALTHATILEHDGAAPADGT